MAQKVFAVEISAFFRYLYHVHRRRREVILRLRYPRDYAVFMEAYAEALLEYAPHVACASREEAVQRVASEGLVRMIVDVAAYICHFLVVADELLLGHFAYQLIGFGCTLLVYLVIWHSRALLRYAYERIGAAVFHILLVLEQYRGYAVRKHFRLGTSLYYADERVVVDASAEVVISAEFVYGA